MPRVVRRRPQSLPFSRLQPWQGPAEASEHITCNEDSSEKAILTRLVPSCQILQSTVLHQLVVGSQRVTPESEASQYPKQTSQVSAAQLP